MHRIESVVVGAGVVGLAAARALAQAGREVVVLEATHGIGNGTSSRNSEVIHAGLYYPSGSLKARVCVDGRRRLYAYCAERGIPHRRCGKLVVATAPDQLPKLEALHRQGEANGVEGLRLVPRDEALAMEPQLACIAALESAETGIIDSHALMLAYQGDAESSGAMIAFGATVERGRVTADGIELHVGGDEPTTIVATQLVNCAGLQAPQLAASIEGLDARHVPTAYYCKGSYFSLTGRSPFSRLVYPMHDSAGLGVHLTLDLGGQARFGPDTEWVDHIDYRVDPSRCASFYAAIRRYWPHLRDDSLQPGYSGIRPKIVGEGQPAADFVIQGPREHGVRGLVNLFGIESPGLTSSLALADEVLRALDDASR